MKKEKIKKKQQRWCGVESYLSPIFLFISSKMSLCFSKRKINFILKKQSITLIVFFFIDKNKGLKDKRKKK